MGSCVLCLERQTWWGRGYAAARLGLGATWSPSFRDAEEGRPFGEGRLRPECGQGRECWPGSTPSSAADDDTTWRSFYYVFTFGNSVKAGKVGGGGGAPLLHMGKLRPREAKRCVRDTWQQQMGRRGGAPQPTSRPWCPWVTVTLSYGASREAGPSPAAAAEHTPSAPFLTHTPAAAPGCPAPPRGYRARRPLRPPCFSLLGLASPGFDHRIAKADGKGSGCSLG